MGVYLFKKIAIALLFLILLCSMGSAAIFLIEPAEMQLNHNDSVEFGEIGVGETVQIIVQRKTDLEFQWDEIAVGQSSLPQNWKAITSTTDKTVVASLTVPQNASESVQRIEFSLKTNSHPFSNQSFIGFLNVKKNLLSVSIDDLKQSAFVGEPASFKLLLNNQSIAKQSIVVKSSLPSYWFEPVEIELEPLQTTDVNLLIFPASYGKKNFSFTVSSELNDFEKSFPADITVFSTLKGKFASAIFGFPFFTVSLLPQLIINAFLALVS